MSRFRNFLRGAQKLWYHIVPYIVAMAMMWLCYFLFDLENRWTHPLVISHEMYSCCVAAVITVLVGFMVGFWTLDAMKKWAKCKLEKVQAFQKPKVDDICMNCSVDTSQGHAVITAFVHQGQYLGYIGEVDIINLDGTIYERKQPEERPKDNNPHMMNKFLMDHLKEKVLYKGKDIGAYLCGELDQRYFILGFKDDRGCIKEFQPQGWINMEACFCTYRFAKPKYVTLVSGENYRSNYEK